MSNFIIRAIASHEGWSIAEVEAAMVHLDVSQYYNGTDFVTVCSCGDEFKGNDPDDADAAAFNHCYPEGGQK